jgi:hypothetical protein
MTEPAGSNPPPPPKPVPVILGEMLGPCTSESENFDQHLEAVKFSIGKAAQDQIVAAEAQAKQEKQTFDKHMDAAVAQVLQRSSGMYSCHCLSIFQCYL